MAINRNPKRRAAGIASTKIVIASASIAATLGGWAAIGAMDTTSGAASAAQNGAIAQAPAQQGAQQETLPNTSTPFGRRSRRGEQQLPFPAPNGESGGLGGTAPQTLPQDGLPGSDDQQQLPGTDDQQTQPQQQLPQAQPQQQQPQQQTTPRVRTRSSR